MTRAKEELLREVERLKASRSWHDFAKDIGLSAGVFYQIRRGAINPGAKVLGKLYQHYPHLKDLIAAYLAEIDGD